MNSQIIETKRRNIFHSLSTNKKLGKVIAGICIILSLLSMIIALCEGLIHDLATIALSTIILVTWLYTSAKVYTRFECCDDAFSETSYKKIFAAFSKNIFVTKKSGEGSTCWSRTVTIFYSIIWILIVGVFVCNYCAICIHDGYQDCLVKAMRIYEFLLLLITLALNGFSFFFCARTVYFIRCVSLEANKLQYNEFLPSKTSGFLKLLSLVRIFAFIFAVITFLYTIIIFYCFPYMRPVTSNPCDVLLNKLTYFTTAFVGIGSAIYIYIAPHAFLRRMINVWKEKSHMEFERRLKSSLTDNKNIERIKTLSSDRIIDGADATTLLISLLACAISIYGILVDNSFIYDALPPPKDILHLSALQGAKDIILSFLMHIVI